MYSLTIIPGDKSSGLNDASLGATTDKQALSPPSQLGVLVIRD